MIAGIIASALALASGVAALAFRIKSGRQRARVEKARADKAVREAAK